MIPILDAEKKAQSEVLRARIRTKSVWQNSLCVYLLFVFVVLGIEPKALLMLGKHSTTESLFSSTTTHTVPLKINCVAHCSTQLAIPRTVFLFISSYHMLNACYMKGTVVCTFLNIN
jgi:hypothetical protein